MNKLKQKRNLIILLVCCILIFSAIVIPCALCLPLQNPLITYYNGTISWEKDKNASKYEIKINNRTLYTNENFYELRKDLSWERQHFDIKVRSIGPTNIKSRYSNSLIFDACKHELAIVRISSEQSPIDGKFQVKFTWPKLANVETYEIRLNDRRIYSNNNNFDPNEKYNYAIIKLSDFELRENVVSITPVIKIKEPYDAVYNTVLNLERSKPLTNIRNYKIVDGQIVYGYDYEMVFDTSSFDAGDLKLLLCNIEKNKIPSDGPLANVYKSKMPKYEIQTDSNGLLQNVIYSEYDNYYIGKKSFTKIELFSEEQELIYTHNKEFDFYTKSYTFQLKENLDKKPYYIKTTVWADDTLLNSETRLINETVEETIKL